MDPYFSPILECCRKYLSLYAWEETSKEMINSLRIADISLVEIHTALDEEGNDILGGAAIFHPFGEAEV